MLVSGGPVHLSPTLSTLLNPLQSSLNLPHPLQQSLTLSNSP